MGSYFGKYIVNGKFFWKFHQSNTVMITSNKYPCIAESKKRSYSQVTFDIDMKLKFN